MKWILVFLLFLSACTSDQEECLDPVAPQPVNGMSYPPTGKASLLKDFSRFSSCNELRDFAMDRWSRRRQFESWSTPEPSICQGITNAETLTDPINSIEQPTNVQEGGMDESDIVKVSEHFIFYARKKTVEVINRRTKTYVQSIPAEGTRRPLMFVFNEHLIVVRSPLDHGSGHDVGIMNQPIYPTWPSSAKMEVLLFDVSKNIRLVDQRSLMGRYRSARLSDEGVLTLIAESSLAAGYDKTTALNHLATVIDKIDCTQVTRSRLQDNDLALTSLYSFDLAQPTLDKKESHVTGSINTVYGKDELYLTRSYIYGRLDEETKQASSYNNLTTRLALKENQWQVQSQFHFLGQTLGPWSFSEQKPYLFVSVSQRDKNNVELQVYKNQDRQTKPVATLTGLAPGETLRSSRFTEDHAYLVTFRTVDPLFVIDIQAPENPAVVSELKIPGFSSYLHKTQDNELIGVGYSEHGNLQLSLFDVSDATNPSLIEQQEVGPEFSDSESQHDHRAFFYDDQWRTLAVPVLSRQYSSKQDKVLSGAFVYSLSHLGFGDPFHLSHEDWSTSYCPRPQKEGWWSRPVDITRVLRIDDQLFSFSDFGLRIHSVVNPSQEFNRTLFANPHEVCMKDESPVTPH